MKTILGVDIGKLGGYSIMKDGKHIESKPFNFTSFKESYSFFFDLVKTQKVDAIITGKPNRMYNIIMRHAPYIGILNLIAEEFNLPVVIANDSTMRATILGKGNGRKKELVHEKYKGETPDVSDAMMFCEWLWVHQS